MRTIVFVAENQITFGEVTVSEKSNEITAVPEWLELIDVEDAIVTADAMSCQKKIVEDSPLNMNVLRKTALSLVTQAQYGRISKKKLMFKAAPNPDILLSIIFSAKK